VGRCGAACDGDDRDLRRCRRVIGRVHPDRVDWGNQNALHAARNQVLHAVDLLELVLVGGHRGHVPAELLRARANAAQHGDVERVVVLRERDADGGLLLAGRGYRQRERGRKHQGGGKRGHAKPEHVKTPPYQGSVIGRRRNRSDHWLLCERSLSAAAAARTRPPPATRCKEESKLSRLSALPSTIMMKPPMTLL